MTDKPTPIAIDGERVLLDRSTNPKALHKILWTRVGSEVQLDLGYYDINEVNTAIEEGKKKQAERVSTNLYITDRFVVSPTTVVQLSEDIEGLVKSLKEVNLWPAK